MQVNKKSAVRSILVFAATSLAAGLAVADGAVEDSSESTWGIGAIASYEMKPYRDFDNKAELMPMLTYENKCLLCPGVSLCPGFYGSFNDIVLLCIMLVDCCVRRYQ